jgi:predicted nucleic acid-binding protein
MSYEKTARSLGLSMICLDTTFVIDLWRNSANADHPAIRFLSHHGGETCTVPAHAVGEFLEGGAVISHERYSESLAFIRKFRIGEITLETAQHYAKIVSRLRSESKLSGISKPDIWIAAWSIEHASSLVTRNPRHFVNIEHLSVLSYDD